VAQVFVVVAAGSVIAFIIRDMGEGALAGWIIQVRRKWHSRHDQNVALLTGSIAGSFAHAGRFVAHCRATL
jgi:hypothetical protein